MGIDFRKHLLFALTAIVLSAQLVFASDPIPPCPDLDWRPLPVMNGPVLKWKDTERNQFQHRARVRGYIRNPGGDTVYPDKNGHRHFELLLSQHEGDNLEVIYNEDFGRLPKNLRAGMQVEACGDFIVATARSGNYPRSPAGAIIHWVHMNPRGKGHPPGYLWIDGVLFGQDADSAPPRRRRSVLMYPFDQLFDASGN